MLKKAQFDKDKTTQDIRLSQEGWREVLRKIGYDELPVGDEIRVRALWRDGKSNNSIAINFKSQCFYDFPKAFGGPLSKLVSITTGKNLEFLDVEKYKEGSFTQSRKATNNSLVVEKPVRYFSNDCAKNLFPQFDYFVNTRKISRKTLRLFECGYAAKEKMAGRMVFIIRDPSNDKIVGFTGRINKDIPKDHPYPKWLHIGNTSNFVYNYRVAFPAIKEQKKVILCESVGDVLSLAEAGIENSICLFGLTLSKKILKYLIRFNPDKIIISTNNDAQKDSNRGEIAAIKIYNQLNVVFSSKKLVIALPPENNDWNEELVKNGPEFIKNWYKENFISTTPCVFDKKSL